MGMVHQDSLKECGLCDSSDDARGCVCASKSTASDAGYDCEAEKLVSKITNMIISELKK